MDKQKVAQLNHEGFFLYGVTVFGEIMPGRSIAIFPPGKWKDDDFVPDTLPDHYRWGFNGTAYESVPDFRGQLVYRPDSTTYYPETWGALPKGDSLTPPPPPPPTLEEARAAKLLAIDAETSTAILAGFTFAVGEGALHFSYDALDQQNFVDTAIGAKLALDGVPGVPTSVTWNGWNITRDTDGKEMSRSLVRLTLTPNEFLGLYMGGALAHKGMQMEIGGVRKVAAKNAATQEELDVI